MQYIAYEIMNLKIMMANFKRKLFISLSLSLSLSLSVAQFLSCVLLYLVSSSTSCGHR
jgi:hypothetical protein